MKLSQKTISRLKKNYGDMVLITGATSGIGRELSIKFGQANFKLIITGRNEKELQSLSTFLFDNYSTESIPIKGDLCEENDIKKLLKETNHLPIGIAILNAGVGTSGKFIDSDISKELKMIDLNCKAVAQMAHHFANKMKGQI